MIDEEREQLDREEGARLRDAFLAWKQRRLDDDARSPHRALVDAGLEQQYGNDDGNEAA